MSELLKLLRESRETIVFTGAGVSTLSGIPDFRGPEGLYSRPDAGRIFDVEEFRRDPSLFYREAREFIYGLEDHDPSLVHTVCARLEVDGLVSRVVTQNIDMLHQRAGSREVIELHGSPRRHDCLACGAERDFIWARERVARGEVPACPDCGGVMKPAITFFGEMLPKEAFHQAATLAAGATLMLVLGSSLTVHPAASIPLQTVRCGGKLAIVNQQTTPLDEHAHWRADDLESVFHELAGQAGYE